MEALKSYFDQVGLRGLKMSFELKKNDKKAAAGRNGVEVRYTR
jgi:hypothetical protein